MKTDLGDLTMVDFKMLIDGELVDGTQEQDVIDPATGAVFTTAPIATRQELDTAVEAAKSAFSAWATRPWQDRQACLNKLADRLEIEAAEFASLLTREQGKPLAEARFEVDATVRTLRYTAQQELPVETRKHSAGVYELHRKPLGVIACITPWNFPLILAANKIAPALLAGNTLVLKPAPTTPLTTLELGRLCASVFPPGVVNVITDANDLGPFLTTHPGVAKVSFTGSTETGKRVMQCAADSIKRVTLELGGNDAAIVMDDADIDAAVSGLVATAFLNAGQVCVAPKRIYVHEKIYDKFTDKFAAAVSELKLGPGGEEGVELGPLQNRSQFEKVLSIMQDAIQEGTVLTGGNAVDGPGFFIEPTVIGDIQEGSRLVDEEQFGPVIPLIRYSDIGDVLTRANRSEQGLGGSVWSTDVENAKRIALGLECGTAWVNQHLALGPDIPFAGAKQSGLGVESGLEGIWEFTQIQVLNIA